MLLSHINMLSSFRGSAASLEMEDTAIAIQKNISQQNAQVRAWVLLA